MLYTRFGFGIPFGAVGVWILLITLLIHLLMPNYAAQESPGEREECDSTGENHATAEDSGIQSSKFLTTKVVLTVSNHPGFLQVPIKT